MSRNLSSLILCPLIIFDFSSDQLKAPSSTPSWTRRKVSVRRERHFAAKPAVSTSIARYVAFLNNCNFEFSPQKKAQKKRDNFYGNHRPDFVFWGWDLFGLWRLGPNSNLCPTMYWLPAYDQLLIIRGRALISKNIARSCRIENFFVSVSLAQFWHISIWLSIAGRDNLKEKTVTPLQVTE